MFAQTVEKKSWGLTQEDVEPLRYWLMCRGPFHSQRETNQAVEQIRTALNSIYEVGRKNNEISGFSDEEPKRIVRKLLDGLLQAIV